MGARIIQLAEIRARLSDSHVEPSALDGAADFAERFHFWTGASGRRYVHTIYSLLDCPEIPAGNYILVRREGRSRRVLAVGRVDSAAPSLNLAQLRHVGANLGANEVHVHLLAGSPKQSLMVELDLRSGQVTPPAYGEACVSETRH
jgi:hypothetical protein